jgi:hypothetical protein
VLVAARLRSRRNRVFREAQMDRWPQASRRPRHGPADALRPHLSLALLVALAALPVLAVAAAVPPQLVLPVISLLALGGAAVTALLAWRMRARANRAAVTPWDVAGALVLIGCVAATLGEPSYVTQFMELSPATE